MKKQPIIALVTLFITLTFTSFNKVMIFDFSGVLADYSKSKMGAYDGAKSLIEHLIHKMPPKKPRELKDAMYHTMLRVPSKDGWENTLIRDDKHILLPTLIAQWQTSKYSCDQLFEQAQTTIEKLHDENFFYNDREQYLVTKVIQAMFDPEYFGRVYQPIKPAEKFLRAVANQKDEAGNPVHQTAILSNFNKEAFDVLQEANKCTSVLKFFNQENIFISGGFTQEVVDEINAQRAPGQKPLTMYDMVKPSPKIFAYVLHKMNVDASECIYFDDQYENVMAAQLMGIRAFQVVDGNFKEIASQLKAEGLIT